MLTRFIDTQRVLCLSHLRVLAHLDVKKGLANFNVDADFEMLVITKFSNHKITHQIKCNKKYKIRPVRITTWSVCKSNGVKYVVSSFVYGLNRQDILGK